MSGKTVYESLNPHLFSHKRAGILGRFMDDRYPNGDFEAKKIEKLARPKNSPIHILLSESEWDDKIVATRYRVDRFRELIALVAIVEDSTGDKTPMVVNTKIVNADGTSDQYYMRTTKAANIPEAREYVLQNILQQIKTWKAKYQMLLKALDLLADFNAIEKKLEGRRHGKAETSGGQKSRRTAK